jgi:NhaA family Na+:H+ antiporter
LAAETGDAFPELNDAELAAMAPLGVRRVVSAGEYLYREGDAGYDFHVVLAGAVEIVVNTDGKERVIVRHSPGRFLGELNLLTGQRVFVSARVAETAKCLRPNDQQQRTVPGSAHHRKLNRTSRRTVARAFTPPGSRDGVPM